MEYRQLEGINQSSLKKILVSPKSYLKEINRNKDEDENNDPQHFKLGKLIDFVLTEPDKHYNDYFFVEPDLKISDSIKEVIRYIFVHYQTINNFDNLPIRNIELIKEAAKKVGYGQSYKEETLINKIQKEGEAYYQCLINSIGKVRITKEDKNKALLTKMAIMSDPNLSKYFKKQKDTEIWFKKVINFNYKGFICKGELDQVYINHTLKEITPLDIKTTSDSVLNFSYNFWKYRYDFQASFYTFGLKQDLQIRELLKVGYKLLPFKFLIIETVGNSIPVIFNTTEEIYNIGAKGGILSTGKQLEGVVQSFERLCWHTENNLWDFPKEYYLNNKEFNIQV